MTATSKLASASRLCQISAKAPVSCGHLAHVCGPNCPIHKSSRQQQLSNGRFPAISRQSVTISAAATSNGSIAEDMAAGRDYEQAYLAQRTRTVCESFPKSMLIDDFIHRLEIGLYSYGFDGENSIACTNLCRDEITCSLKEKIDSVFGNSFNVNGLGGVLTSGVIGVGAGLSHSPIDADSGKERYVFFSFPHIAISPFHENGTLRRSNRPGDSKACGALVAALGQLQSQGLEANAKKPGVHEPENPEYSILIQRLARCIQKQGKTEEDIPNMTLVDITKVAEQAITADLEFLISKAVDPQKADYAVVTGVQIHSWGKIWEDDSPNLEYVQPCMVYTVVNGEKTLLDLTKIPALTPRQTKELNLARRADVSGDAPEAVLKPKSSTYVLGQSAGLEKSAKYQQLLAGLGNGN